MMEQMNRASRTTGDSMSRAQSATNRLGGAVSSASNRMGGFATRVTSLRVGADGLSASLRGMQGALVGIAGAYVGANGMAKLFNATIGEAAKFEQSKAVITAAFQDDNATKQYMKMVDKIAIDSPLLNSGDMFGSSKGLLTLSKNMPELENAWSIVERLIASDPTKSIDDAVRGLRELSSGDTQSLREVFNLDKNILNDVKGGSFEEQLKGLDKALNKMNITQKTVEAMGSTTLGRFNSMKERIGTFFRDMGGESNTKLGDFLKRINDSIDKLDVKSISDKLGSMLGKATDKAIALYDLFVKWRKPIAYAAGAIATFVAALAVVGTISALANPIALIAMGIAAAAVGFKALYDNSETFRGAIEKVVTVVKDLWSVFEKGGVEGLISVLFPPDVAEKINGIITGIKTKISELMTAFENGGVGGVFDKLFGEGSFETLKTKFEEVKSYLTEKITQFQDGFDRLKEALSQAWTTISDIISNVWTIIEPYLSAFWNMLQVIGDVAMKVFDNIIAPAISFLSQLFSTLWSIAKPILMALGLAWEALSAVIKWVWDNVLAPLVDFILTGVKNALDNFSEALSVVQGWFETLSGWVSTAYGHVKDFIGFIGKAKMPSWITNGISAGVNFVGDLIGAGEGKKGGKKSHYSGLDSVPYDGYSARLHKGERVLTARENKDYSEGNGGGTGGGVVITGNNFTVREDADVQRIAYELAKLIEKERTQVG
ncbi:phage tail tape measure protein [Lysinibacillus irui]|uniref:Phage tail tape measure protein n=1 Tax=Lysinibacillus irui TaxID=2998077 RepID=A0ABU5NKE7_9BACI|nr:phage tail tape measure protein [Lysinibacillus irui]MEA0554754.1 phage tail tape measure protein [Lysinibacillus irui]MEA0976469.1 phage tail tape measure protein [Lysinibacillus irui]MEA1042623.1 phage tail tape measure protein [Lysinibacillus irui]